MYKPKDLGTIWLPPWITRVGLADFAGYGVVPIFLSSLHVSVSPEAAFSVEEDDHKADVSELQKSVQLMDGSKVIFM